MPYVGQKPADIIATAVDTTTGTFSGALDVKGAAVFNEDSADVDFRVESNANANMLFVNGGSDAVGVGTVNVPSNKNTVTPVLNVSGSGVKGAAQITRHTSVGGGGALLHLAGTRGTDVNSYTILQDDDGIGTIAFQASDGNEFVTAAQIIANVDGTPGDNDMPTRLSFSTTADGASSSTERMRIHNGGVVSFNNGIALGVGTANTASNVLDDYEEGTWTPSHGGNTSYTARTGRYIKVGNKVFITGQVHINVLGTGSASAITGLPFTSVTTVNGNPAGTLAVNYYANLAIAVIHIAGYVTSNATTINTVANVTANATIQYNTGDFYQNNSRIDFAMTYEVA